jgi:phage baseplate assembly protein W|tara:strand:+ start:530 stop:1003 length:474 start_codon:yes stop_codon:yes gene_type:complete
MPIKLNILEPERDQRDDTIYRDIDLNVNVGIVKGNSAASPENLKDLNTSVNFEAIKNSLINLITTFPGQKILNPEFGMNFGDLLFLPVSKARATVVGETINNTVAGFEPRIQVTFIEVTADIENQEYELDIEITIPEFNNNPLNLKGRLNKSGFYSY